MTIVPIFFLPDLFKLKKGMMGKTTKTACDSSGSWSLKFFSFLKLIVQGMLYQSDGTLTIFSGCFFHVSCFPTLPVVGATFSIHGRLW